MIWEFKKIIQPIIKEKLPGVEAHKKVMANREGYEKYAMDRGSARESAVLLLVYINEGKFYTVLTQRPKYVGVHSGQISLPGGKREVFDEDLQATALREANEELGIISNKVEVLGGLTPLYIPPSNFLVYPYLGISEGIPDFIPDHIEVERVLELPIEDFLEHDALIETSIRLANNQNLRTKAYQIEEHLIWGATCMILTEFFSIISETKKLSELIRNR